MTGITFGAARGEIFALLGTNGAGKTSSVEVLEGLTRPEGGSVRALGHDPYRERAAVRPRILVMLREGGFPRGALAALLALEEDQVVVAEVATGPGALVMARAHRPDVADLRTPSAGGVTVATSLRDELPDRRTMIVTSHRLPGRLKRAIMTGVRCFVPQTVSAQRLAEILRTVHAGNRCVDPELVADAISAGDSPPTATGGRGARSGSGRGARRGSPSGTACPRGRYGTTFPRPPRSWVRRTGPRR